MDTKQASEQIVAEFPDLFSEAFDVWLPPGWYTLAHECCAAIVQVAPQARARQLKEKFGGARFYVDGAPRELIDHFETASFSVCQTCGAPGEQKAPPGGWVRTLCGACK